MCRVLSFLVLLFVIVFVSSASAAEDYKLGIQDQIRLHVRGWRELQGDFTVNANGNLSFPVIGEVSAIGLRPSELARAVSKKLALELQLPRRPISSAEIIKYRPFYILGSVNNPGEYPYRPGMLVLSAISIAGGIYRPPSSDSTFNAAKELNILHQQKLASKAKELRLSAEAKGLPTLPGLPEKYRSQAETYVNQEILLFEANNQGHKTKVQFLKKQISLNEEHIRSLHSEIAVLEEERAIVEKDRDIVRKLLDRGLSNSSRLLPLDRAISQLKGDKQQLNTRIILSQTRINTARSEIAALIDQRRQTALSELGNLRAELVLLEERERFTRSLLGIAGSISEAGISNSGNEHQQALIFLVVRRVGENIKEMVISETSRIEPGDILKVYPTTSTSSVTQQPRAAMNLLSFGSEKDVVQ